MINRMPVLTLWAVAVAQISGFQHNETLTLRRVVAGLNARSKRSAPGARRGDPGILVILPTSTQPIIRHLCHCLWVTNSFSLSIGDIVAWQLQGRIAFANTPGIFLLDMQFPSLYI